MRQPSISVKRTKEVGRKLKKEEGGGGREERKKKKEGGLEG